MSGLTTKFFLPIISSILLFAACEGSRVLAPFQVAIRLTDPDIASISGNPPINLGNGVIISSKYILTTAGCVHMPTPWSTTGSRPIPASSLYIVAGNFTITSNDGGTKRNVVSVIVHDKFNPVNYTNDIALLKLDRALTFDATAVNWVELQNASSPTAPNEYKCSINPQDSQGYDSSSYPYFNVPNISLVDLWLCHHNTTQHPEMCLMYTTKNPVLCNTTLQVLRYSSERGTSLVCNNRVTGLLSEIHKAINVQHCESTGKTFATYTRVSEFVSWIKSETGLWGNTTSEVAPPSWSQTQQHPNKNSAHRVAERPVLGVLILLIAKILLE